ncbi:MAG: nitroreductase family protein [Candidatus Fermentibacteraceae bacterium]|nr:nitroreductase family protein [Candidatus Fermentibacteraceae bacterium]
MTLLELAGKNRSTRRFRQNVRLSRKQLMEIIEAARLAPCGANLQLLRFTPVWEEELCSRIFPHLNWAGYLKEWDGPAEGERPAAYIIIQMPVEERRHFPVDAGIAAAYMTLAARESGFGSCMIMSFGPGPVSHEAGSPEGYSPFMVIALGAPGEEVVLEEARDGIEYYRDGRDVHHVPKIDIKDLVTR